MNEILDLFHTYSENIITEEMNNGEFDRLIRFADNSEDPYYYCFKDEGCHIIYHRFLPEDYADLTFKEEIFYVYCRNLPDKRFLFGRTLDYEFPMVTRLPSPAELSVSFRHAGEMNTHYAIIGMAHVAGIILSIMMPSTKKGLGIAGLNFRWKRNIQTRRSKQFQTSDHPV